MIIRDKSIFNKIFQKCSKKIKRFKLINMIQVYGEGNILGMFRRGLNQLSKKLNLEIKSQFTRKFHTSKQLYSCHKNFSEKVKEDFFKFNIEGKKVLKMSKEITLKTVYHPTIFEIGEEVKIGEKIYVELYLTNVTTENKVFKSGKDDIEVEKIDFKNLKNQQHYLGKQVLKIIVEKDYLMERGVLEGSNFFCEKRVSKELTNLVVNKLKEITVLEKSLPLAITKDGIEKLEGEIIKTNKKNYNGKEYQEDDEFYK